MVRKITLMVTLLAGVAATEGPGPGPSPYPIR